MKMKEVVEGGEKTKKIFVLHVISITALYR
jgi:hypothetical protein